MNKPLARAEVALAHTWDLGDLFPDEAAWAHELQAVAEAAEHFGRFAGKLGEGPGTLLACLDERDCLWARMQRVAVHAHLRQAADGTDAAAQAAAGRANTMGARAGAAMSFVDPEILALPEGTVERWRTEQPGLEVHRTALDDLLAIRAHMLSAETEKTLAALGRVLSGPIETYDRSRSSDLRFAPFTDPSGATHENSFNRYEWVYESHRDTGVRRAAWQSFSAGLVPYRHTYATTFSLEVSKQVVLARARGYATAEHAQLQKHKIPFDLYTMVVERVQAGIAPAMRRYAQLRRRVLGLDRMLYCDLKAPLDPDFEPAVSFEDAGRLIVDAVAPMGGDYQDMVRSALARRWIDRADNVGKAAGAFCASPYLAHPYILVTWADTMHDAFVLAHELGHAGHFFLANGHQRFVNTRPAMPFMEAPSILNEVLLARHILARDQDPRMRRWVIMQVLGTYHHNFVTHLLEAQLQREVYQAAEQGETVTATLLDARKKAILQRFWGDAVEIDDDAARTWMRQIHYYLGLYPYTYSVGLVAATALAEKARVEGPQVFTRWLDVLKSGGTQPPLDLLRMAGIDLATPSPIEAAATYVGSLVDELEAAF